jgi:hypothetical protein
MYIARFTPTAGISFYLTSLVQVVVGALSYSILLLAFVIVIRSPVWSFVIYFGWSLVEGILFAAFNSLLEIRLKWLPIHLIRTFYVIDGEPKVVNYYNPFMEAPPSLIAPTILTLGLLIMVKLVIEHRDLPPLSD